MLKLMQKKKCTDRALKGEEERKKEEKKKVEPFDKPWRNWAGSTTLFNF